MWILQQKYICLHFCVCKYSLYLDCIQSRLNLSVCHLPASSQILYVMWSHGRSITSRRQKVKTTLQNSSYQISAQTFQTFNQKQQHLSCFPLYKQFFLTVYASNIQTKWVFFYIFGCFSRYLSLCLCLSLFSRSSAPISVTQRAPGGPVSQTARGKQCAKTTHAYAGAEATQVTHRNLDTHPNDCT